MTTIRRIPGIVKSSRPRRPIWLALPALITLLLVQIYPTVYSYYLSLGRITRRQPLVRGATQLRAALRQLSDFYQSLQRTGVYASSYLILSLGAGLGLALLLNRRPRFTAFYMACIFIPYVISEVVAGTMWSWMFQQSYGIVQVALNPLVGNVSIMSREAGAMAIVIAASVWKHMAFNALLFLGRAPGGITRGLRIGGARRRQSVADAHTHHLAPDPTDAPGGGLAHLDPRHQRAGLDPGNDQRWTPAPQQ